VAGARIWGGAAREANLYQVDGLTLTHPGSGGYLVPLSPSWVEAVEVRGMGAGADVGNFQGGVVNLVLRSGSNTPRSTVRTTVESLELNASHDVVNEISRERVARNDVELDWSGPLRPDRLFLFAGGHLLRDSYRARAHTPAAGGPHLPQREVRLDVRGLARLTWTPSPLDRLDGSMVLSHAQARNWALTGYEAEGAAPDYSAPSRLLMLSWRRLLGDDGRFELRASHAASDERWLAPAGSAVPAIRTYTPGDPPSPVYGNTPFEVERRPGITSAVATLSHAVSTGPVRHELEAGAELSAGRWVDRRIRTGGMTWRPARSQRFDASSPESWFFSGFIPVDWGGEVDLHARTRTQAAFAQSRMTLHPRLWLNAGARATAWQGDLLPQGDAARVVRAIRTAAWEPRLGAVVDVAGGGAVLAKAHWGRYHQNLLAPMFDRVAGGDVFNDRELWYYYGSAPDSPARTFTPAQRDAMQSGDPRFVLWERIRLNEAGVVAPDYRQPHMDQWLAGFEAGTRGLLRAEAVFIQRRYHNLVALQDRNLAQNYHRYDNVLVRTADGEPVLLDGAPMVLPALYIPYSAIIRQIEYVLGSADVPMPPGFTAADLAWLQREQPDLVLGNVPDARRLLRQLQLTARAGQNEWGAAVSLVLSRLTGNLDAVTGYEAGTGYDRFWEVGAGPYVRPNEQTNASGRLPGVHPIELKATLHGRLPLSFRGGMVLEARRGEYFTPYLALTGATHTFFTSGGEVGRQMVHEVAGQRVFVDERGAANYADRVTLDARLERDLPLRGGEWRISADVFNLWNADTATRINPSVTYPSTQTSSVFATVPPPAVFRAVWERLPPRTLRLGLSRSGGGIR
jgi:hypothetical protein